MISQLDAATSAVLRQLCRELQQQSSHQPTTESIIYSQHLWIKHASTLTPCELVGFCQNGDAPGGLIAEEGHSGGSSQLGLARRDLEALQLHGEAHVPGDLELPLEECLETQVEWGGMMYHQLSLTDFQKNLVF